MGELQSETGSSDDGNLDGSADVHRRRPRDQGYLWQEAYSEDWTRTTCRTDLESCTDTWRRAVNG